jgi:predicted Zn-dependent protease
MFRIIKLLSIVFFLINFTIISFAKEDFFNEAKTKFDLNNLTESKFLLQRNIVYNPKHAKSYLYLAKIYNLEENEKEEEKNINTVLLLEPKNEEAIYMLIKIQLKKSNYLKVKELSKTFIKNCKNLCEKNKSILESLKNLEPKNES